MSAALYAVRTTHVRSERVRNVFEHDFYLWFVDLDALPRLPRWLAPLARFDARDHGSGAGGTGDQGRAIRAELEQWLAAQGEPVPRGPVFMLASARVLGYVFNPLTVYWCHRGDGELVCVVAEVHNTYGGRHRYLLHPDEQGEAHAEKAFYVSPFLEMGGRYRMQLPKPGQRLRLSVALEQHGNRSLLATLRGTRSPADARTLLRLALRYPLAPLRAAAAIRGHGIALWLRGLPIVRRNQEQEVS